MLRTLFPRDRDQILVLPLVGAQLVIGTSLFLLPVLVDTLKGRAGLTGRSAGLLVSMELAVAAITTVVLSAFSSRHSVRSLAIAGATLNVFAALGTLTSSAPTVLIASRLAAGVGAGMVGAGGTCFLSRAFDKERIIAVVTLSSILDAAIWLALLPYMVDRLGYRAPYICLLIVGLIGAALLLRLPGMRYRRRKAHASMSTNTLPSLLVVAAVFLTQLGQGAFWSMEEFYGRAAGFNDHGIGVILAVSTLLLLFGAMGAAWAGERYGRFTTLFGLLFANAVAMYLASTIAVHWVYVAANVVQAITNLSCVIYQLGLSARMDRHGRTVAASTALVTLGNGIGPALAATLGVAAVATATLVLNGVALALYGIVMMRFVDESQMTPSLT
ncbi:MFS transporter [Occallatibacter riparius]|uniref:MFS transporter n=1 Tax=Occallatibacter riparius TaxID=1002689 RepID=A0A9J7BKI2_9BACT|nr:MFS transporter [Occallatibacter riparius]UWZ82290.1 MFS transporter [Occallatibacter riparius]